MLALCRHVQVRIQQVVRIFACFSLLSVKNINLLFACFHPRNVMSCLKHNPRTNSVSKHTKVPNPVKCKNKGLDIHSESNVVDLAVCSFHVRVSTFVCCHCFMSYLYTYPLLTLIQLSSLSKMFCCCSVYVSTALTMCFELHAGCNSHAATQRDYC